MSTSYTRALLVAITLLAAASCMAQSITGVVYDQDGAVVPNARVFLMEDYVKQQETRSGEAGNFTFLGLPRACIRCKRSKSVSRWLNKQ